jgi:hypothetical protein
MPSKPLKVPLKFVGIACSDLLALQPRPAGGNDSRNNTRRFIDYQWFARLVSQEATGVKSCVEHMRVSKSITGPHLVPGPDFGGTLVANTNCSPRV